MERVGAKELIQKQQKQWQDNNTAHNYLNPQSISIFLNLSLDDLTIRCFGYSPDVFKKTLGEVYTYFFNMCEPGQNWGSCALVLKAYYNPDCPDLIDDPEEPFGGVTRDIVEDYVLFGKVNMVGTKRT